jgi:DNA-directed RNA polymerase beta subunit
MRERLLWDPTALQKKKRSVPGAPKSDAYRMLVCRKCGRMMVHNGRVCAACRTSEGALPVIVPYNFKLLLHEMASCGIGWQLEVS